MVWFVGATHFCDANKALQPETKHDNEDNETFRSEIFKLFVLLEL